MVTVSDIEKKNSQTGATLTAGQPCTIKTIKEMKGEKLMTVERIADKMSFGWFKQGNLRAVSQDVVRIDHLEVYILYKYTMW